MMEAKKPGEKMDKANRKKRQTKNPRGEAKPPKQTKASPALAPFEMERTLRDIERAMQEQEFESPEDVNAFLSKLRGSGLKKALAKTSKPTAKQQAQELAYQAMEAEDPEEIKRFAQNALAKDPDCVDALVMLASITSRSDEEHISGLEKAVEAGERSLGAEFFRENKGHFWGILETRPYMRARHQLADLLYSVGRTSEAIQHFEAMLELNPNDNQGLRDILLPCYLAADDLEGARRLLREYAEDYSAVFNWGRTLERYLSEGPKAALPELRKARKQNPYVEAYLTGKKRLPDELPSTYAFGSEEEAILCADLLLEAWVLHPPALKWLVDNARVT